MPKITIREIDNTGVSNYDYLDHTVFVPGIKLEEIDPETEEVVGTLTGLYTDPDEFRKKYAKVKSAGTGVDLGVTIAYECLKAGLSVEYYGLYTTLGSIKSDDEDKVIEKMFEEAEDRGLYDLRFITIGGLVSHEDPTVVAQAYQAAIKCAGKRADAVALIDCPKNVLTTKDVKEWIDTNLQNSLKDIVARKGVDIWSGSDSKTYNENYYGKYAACFAPFFITKLNLINSTGKAVECELPASLNYLVCYGRNVGNYSSWHAMAGSIRGVSGYDITPIYKYGEADVEQLEPRSLLGEERSMEFAVNLLRRVRPFGNIIWGNRTMYPISTADGGKDNELRASSFLNVRNLCSTLKKTLYRVSRKYTFENNSDLLWLKFIGDITPLLDKMKANEGCRGYQIIKEKTNKKALLKARIKIIPIEAVEDFDLTIELTDSIEVNE